MDNQPWVDELLVPIGACQRGIDIANRFTDAQKAWDNWPVSDIVDLLWTVGHSDHPDKDRLLRHFACDCAERVLHIFESKYPDDKRPRRAIDVSRLYADGKVTMKELEYAIVDAIAASTDSASDSKMEGSSEFDKSAAWAADSAYHSSAKLFLTWSIARNAALTAGWAAAWYDDYEKELYSARVWQCERILYYFPKNPLLKGEK